jgi:hypothetical protein
MAMLPKIVHELATDEPAASNYDDLEMFIPIARAAHFKPPSSPVGGAVWRNSLAARYTPDEPDPDWTTFAGGRTNRSGSR